MHRFVSLWVTVRSSLWFVPTLIVVFAVLLGLVLAELGRMHPYFAQASLPGIFGFSAEGSRAMLSAIASSMITVAGVAFSITIVALSLASTQYSPRVLRHFMRDQGNQIVLGVFVGIFAYCLVVLPLVRGGEEEGYVPAVAVAFAVVLALAGVGCLIYFIHHVATAIQASSIVASISAETHQAISDLFQETVQHDAEKPRELLEITWHVIPAPKTGVLQMVNEKALLELAVANQLVLRIDCQVGDFIVEGTPLLASSQPEAENDDLKSDIVAAFTINRTRTIEQDPAYGFRQLVDIALRALSPSLNDSTTAILCINSFADLLRHMAGRHIASPFRRHEGVVRLIANQPDFSDYIRLAFDEIMDSTNGSVTILNRLLWAIETIAHQSPTAERCQALAEAARTLGEYAEREVEHPAGRSALRERVGNLRTNLCRPR